MRENIHQVCICIILYHIYKSREGTPYFAKFTELFDFMLYV